MRTVKQFLAGVCALVLSSVTVAQAQTSPEVTRGLTWLQSQIQTDGTLNPALTTIATAEQGRAETLQTLTLLGTSSNILAAKVAAAGDLGTEYLARRVISLSLANQPQPTLIADLLARMNADGGVGANSFYTSNPLDTAFLLLALKAANSTDTTSINKALGYLTQSKNAAGAWGVQEQDRVYVTAYVLLAADAWKANFSVATITSPAKDWLLTQRTNAQFGSVMLNAVSLLALATQTSDTTALQPLATALKTAQDANGSWSNDPYVTALALRALWFVGQSAPPATTGEVLGSVVDDATNQSLADATIQILENTSLATTSSTSGTFSLTGIPAGSYTLRISKLGYDAKQATLQIVAGQSINLGAVRLKVSSFTATVSGVIKNSSGTALADVLVSVGTNTAITSATGQYQIAGIAPGSLTISAAKQGYQTASATVAFEAGKAYIFSPTLYTTGATQPVPSLKGKIIDATTNAAISGATVTLGQATKTTTATGTFEFTGLVAGAFSMTVAANTYQSITLSGSLVSGPNDVGNVALSKAAAASTITGIVADASTNAPIAGATVAVQGSALTATSGADGKYSIAGLTTTSFKLLVSAAGYLTSTQNVALQQVGTAILDLKLTKSQPSGITLESVKTNKPIYLPNDELVVEVELRNTQTAAVDVVVETLVIDAQNSIALELKANANGLGANPPNLPISLGAASVRLVPMSKFLNRQASGSYTAVVRVYDANGLVIGEGRTPFTVTAAAILGGGLIIDPPLTQAGTNTPVRFIGQIGNTGNQVIAAGDMELVVTLTTPDNQTSSTPQTQVRTLATGNTFRYPTGVAIDTAGNVYTGSGQTNDGRVFKIDPQGQFAVVATVPTTESPYFTDIALDADGNLWLPNNSNRKVFKVTPQGAISSIVVTQLTTLSGIDIDASGSLILTGSSSGEARIIKRTPQGTETVLWANGLNQPIGMVRDLQGNLVIANYGDGTLSKVDSAGAIKTFARGLLRPQGIAMDGAGTFFVANSGDNTVAKVTPDGTVTTFATGFNQPSDVKLDAAGNVFVSNTGDNSIIRVSAAGVKEVFARGIANTPTGLAYDSAGNLYIANSDGTLRQKSVQNEVSILATGLSSAQGLAVDGTGAVLVANAGSGSVTKHVGTTKTTFATGLSSPYGVAIEPAGSVYVTERGFNRISRFDSNGVSLGPLLSPVSSPAELSIDATGKIFVRNTDSIGVIEAGIARTFVPNFTSVLAVSPDPASGGVVALKSYDVYRISATGVPTLLKTLPFYPYGIGVTATGNIVIGDYSNKRVHMLDAGGNLSVLATLPNNIRQVVTDFAGNVFARSDYAIYRVNLDGTFVQLSLFTEYLTGISAVADNKLVAWTNAAKIYSLDALSGATTVLRTSSSVQGVTRDSLGQLWATFSSDNRVIAYDAIGAVAKTIDGFSTPTAIVWAGSEFQFLDSNSRLFKVPVGGLPTRISNSFYAQHLAMRNGVLHGASGNSVVRWTGTQSQVVATIGNSPSLYGIATLADGTVTVADNLNSRVVTLNSTNAVVSDFAGIVSPKGLAFDTAGRLHVANTGSNTIARFNGSSNSLETVTRIGGPKFLTVEASGGLIVTTNGGVSRVNPQGVASVVESGRVMEAITSDASGIFGVENSASKLRKLVGTTFQTVSAGLSTPMGVRVAPDGGIFVASNANNTIVKLSSNQLDVIATDLTAPRAIDLDASGRLFAVGDQGGVWQIAQNAATVTLPVAALLNSNRLSGVGVRPDGKLVVTDWAYPIGNIAEISVTQPVAAPPAGTIVHRAVVPVNVLVPSDERTLVNFGTWLPPYGGDFIGEIRRTGVAGVVSNYLHVGPYAESKLATLKSEVPPGDQTVPLQLKVSGADFTSISRVETALIKPTVQISFPNGMVADKAGNIYFTDSSTLKKALPSGETSTVLSGLQTRFGLAVDSRERFYLPSFGSGEYQLLQVLTDGTKKVIANLGSTVNGVAVNSRDEVLVGAPGRLLKINPDTGVVTTVTSVGMPSPRGIAIDGKDNVYVQNESNFVSQIKPDGSATTVFSKGDGIEDPIFEGDGYPNIAADCADNFYIATSQWKKINQSGEEHIVAQVIPRTGRIAALFDGLQISSSLNDIDYLSYDRFGNRLLMWNHGDSKIWTVPVTCGAISVEAHIVTKPGQTLTGFSTAPSASVPLADGRTDYVWSLRDVTTSGATIAFDTILKGLKLGDLASVADSGYTLFKNSFSPTDVRVPLDIPTVRVSNLVSLNVATDKGDYAANATADISSTLVNAFTRTIGGNLTIEVLDKTGSRIAVVTQQGVVIPANGTIPVNAPFGIGQLTPAQYTVKATLVDNGIEQAKAQSTFNVLPDNVSASAKSSVVTDKTKYNPTDRVLITSRLVSQSANVNLDNLTLMVRVYDPSNQLLFTHGHVVAQLLAGATREFSVNQPLTNGAEGTYTVRQELLDNQNRVIDQSQTTYDIGASSSTGFGLSGTIAVSPKEVRVGETVSLSGTASNSGNSVITNLPLTIRVVDPDRNLTVVEYPVTAASIAVSGSFTVPSNTWAANVRPNATYLAVLVATVGTGASVAQQTLATDTIKVIPQVANTITATAGTPQSAKLSQPYANALEATVRDTAGNPFPGATVTFSAPAAGASATFSTAASGVTDAAGKVRVNVTANATAGSFAVTASTPGVASNVSFALTNTALTPPTITFVSPANNTSVNAPGSFALTAAVTTPDSTVSKVEFFNGASLLGTGTLGGSNPGGSNYVYNWTNVVVGEYPNVTAKVTDNKNQTATTSALRLIVAGCGTAAPFAFTPQQNVPLSTAITSNAITVTGITCPVDISVTGGEISINNAAFTAAASTVKLNDTVRVRVTSSNENNKAVSALVTIGTVKGSFVVTTLSKADVTQTALNEARILVLVSCPSSSGKSASAPDAEGNADSAMTKSLTKAADKDEDDDSTCAKARKVFVDDYLTSLGVEFMTVTNVVDFKRELRCGKYNTYWISGGFAKLKGTLDDELAEAVSRGESLIVDGVHDTRNKLIDEVSGAKYTGVISGNDHEVILSGTVMPTGAFTSKGRAAKTTFTDAAVHGLFDSATSTNTAIASDAYGLGKALTFAFDWVATAQQAASAVTAKEAMKRGISLIAPSAPTDLTPNEYVRFKTSVANPAESAGTFEIAATLPPAAVFASSVPAPTSITGNVAKWRITAPANGSAEVVYSFRTPTQDSVQPVATTVSSVVDSTLTEIAAKSTPLAVIGYAARSAAVKTQIEALNPTPSAEQQARDKAVTYLADATAKRTANSLQDAIEALLKVQGELDRLTSLNTQTVQVQVGLLIKTVEREFCLSGQTEFYCTATASFSSNGAFTDVDSNDGNLKLIRVRGGGPGSPATGTLGGVWRVGSIIKQGVTEVKSVDNFTTYTSGKIYNWTFEYKGNGKTIFTLVDPARPATIVTQNDRWIVKNALKFSVHADAGIGANFKIESNILTLNGAPLTDGKIITNSNNLVSDISKVLAGPALTQPFIVTGTVILTFPPPAPVPGDKLYFQINGGEAPCADDEGK
jgi:sugar lactone lactonase YvrE